MQLLAQAEAALVRNWRAILIYVASSVLVVTAYSHLVTYLDTIVSPETNPKPFWFVSVGLVGDVIQIVIIATIQAVAFAWIGQEMDRPLWKSAGWTDSVKRFFSFWLILNLLYVTSAKFTVALPESIRDDVELLTFFFRFGLTLFGIPIGACVMHGGGLHWKELPGMLSPMFQLFPMAAVAIGLGFLQFALILVTIIVVPEPMLKSPWLWSAVNVPIVFLECMSFAVMWLVCMHYRDIASESGGDDFDF